MGADRNKRTAETTENAETVGNASELCVLRALRGRVYPRSSAKPAFIRMLFGYGVLPPQANTTRTLSTYHVVGWE